MGFHSFIDTALTIKISVYVAFGALLVAGMFLVLSVTLKKSCIVIGACLSAIVSGM